MSYRRTWAHTFKTEEFKITASMPGQSTPFVCPEHPSYCFRVDGYFPPQWGWWGLIDLVDIPTALPGTKKKLLEATIEGMVKWGGAVASTSRLQLKVDGATILDRFVYNQADDFQVNRFALNRDVETAIKLNVELLQEAAVYMPGSWVNKHDANINLSGEYYVDTPPELATVEATVVDKTNNKALRNVYVAIMSGSVVEAEGYTGWDGRVTFENIAEGSYILRVSISGYHDLEQSIDVAPPKVSYVVKLVPIPSPPLPWWLIPSAVGIIAVGAFVVLRKPKLPIIVVK